MRVRWDGAAGAVNRDVGAETGEGDVLEQGQVVEVSEGLGENLVRYSADWHFADGDPLAELIVQKREELNAIAAELGIEDPSGYPNKPSLARAIVEARAGGEAS